MSAGRQAGLVNRVALRMLVVVSLGMCVGCETVRVTTVDRDADRVRLNVANLSDYEWRITARQIDGLDSLDTRVLPRATIRCDLAGGTYQVEQRVVDATGIEEPGRTFESVLVAGESYRWRLITLMGLQATSPSETEAAPDPWPAAKGN